MHIHIVPNRKSKPTVLLRESYRDGKKVKKRTLANLTSLPMSQVELIRLILKGEALVSPERAFEVERSQHHGHVQAVLNTMKLLGFEKLIGSRPSRNRDLVVSMVAARILEPQTKLATTRWWKTTTLPAILEVSDASEGDLYAAMDWLLEGQSRIEQKLASRHLKEEGLVLYDLTSSYFEGSTCPLAARGHNRDGKKGKLQVNYGLLTDERGCPIAVSVFRGNTADPKTLLPQVAKVQEQFGIEAMVLVGDRGMISQKQIDQIKGLSGINWITALRSGSIGKLVDDEALQMGLFDELNLFEFTHPDYPGERLIACRNPELAKLRDHKRQSLLASTVKELETVKSMVARRRLLGKDKIGVRIGKVINRYKVAKHFVLDIQDNTVTWCIDEEKVAAESALDGLYVIRTSLTEKRMGAEDIVRSYKSLSRVEQAFRSFKSIDLEVRPIHHRLETRVKAHIFLCMLSYYVKWHMMEAWRSLLFADEDLQLKETRDPVAPAKKSAEAVRKARTKVLKNGTEVHSFSTLLNSLSTIVRNTCRQSADNKVNLTFTLDTRPTPKQQEAYNLLNTIKM